MRVADSGNSQPSVCYGVLGRFGDIGQIFRRNAVRFAMADDTSSCQNADGVAIDDQIDRIGADVFSACRDGDISRLKSLVDGRLKDEVRSLVACKTNGASSLIMACRNGHAAVVSFLVTRCHADIELVGSVTFDGEVRSLQSVIASQPEFYLRMFT